MSPEAQRIAIAEACGWKHIGAEKNLPLYGWIEQGPFEQIPDYLTDLNAMHEAVASQSWDASQMLLFENALHVVVAPHYTTTAPLYVWCMMNATAAQRAEAFLRAIGKWEDGK